MLPRIIGGPGGEGMTRGCQSRGPTSSSPPVASQGERCQNGERNDGEPANFLKTGGHVPTARRRERGRSSLALIFRSLGFFELLAINSRQGQAS